MTINKFAAFTNKFDEMREKLQKNKQEQEENANKGSFDYSWKFEPKLPENKPKIVFKVRILPNVHNPDAAYPWITGIYHMYRKPDGKFLYTLCPTNNDVKGKGAKTPCPICEKAVALFATQDKKDEDLARKMYKKPRFFMNVLILEDPRAPEQNQKGQVLIFEYGKKLQTKIEDATVEQKMDISNPIAGHDLNIVIKRQGEFTNYDSTSFSIEKTAIAETDAEMNTIFDSILNLQEKVFARGPQTYEKLVNFMNSTGDTKNKTKATEEVDPTESIDDVAPKPTPKVVQKTVAAPSKPEKAPSAKSAEEDLDLDFDFSET